LFLGGTINFFLFLGGTINFKWFLNKKILYFFVTLYSWAANPIDKYKYIRDRTINTHEMLLLKLGLVGLDQPPDGREGFQAIPGLKARQARPPFSIGSPAFLILINHESWLKTGLFTDMDEDRLFLVRSGPYPPLVPPSVRAVRYTLIFSLHMYYRPSLGPI
jgi:hypothetical protein